MNLMEDVENLEEHNYKVYKHILPNGKVYIGITKRPIEYRWNHGNNYKNQPFFFSAIVKYGWNNIKHEILAENLSFEEAAKLENEYIEQYRSSEPEYGYNISHGALEFPNEIYGKKSMSEETKLIKSIKMSAATKAGWDNPVVRQRRLEGLRKNSQNPEYRKNVSEGLKKALQNPELRKQRSDYMKERMSDPIYKKECLDCLQKANDEKIKKKVRCINTGIEYNSLKEASDMTGISISSISKSLRHVTKNPEYKWEYVDEKWRSRYV